MIRRTAFYSGVMMAAVLMASPSWAAGDDVTVDSGLTPDVVAAFRAAKTIGMPVTLDLDIATAEAFEQIGHYEVTPDRQLGAQGNVLMDSEKKAMLAKICTGSKPDVALMISYKMTGNSGVAGAFIGKVHVHFDWTMNYEFCKPGTIGIVTGTLTNKQSTFGAQGRSQMVATWANTLVTKFVEAVGRT